MTKPISKKLRVNKETLRYLSPAALSEIRGGREELINAQGGEAESEACDNGNGTKDCLNGNGTKDCLF